MLVSNTLYRFSKFIKTVNVSRVSIYRCSQLLGLAIAMCINHPGVFEAKLVVGPLRKSNFIHSGGDFLAVLFYRGSGCFDYVYCFLRNCHSL